MEIKSMASHTARIQDKLIISVKRQKRQTELPGELVFPDYTLNLSMYWSLLEVVKPGRNKIKITL